MKKIYIVSTPRIANEWFVTAIFWLVTPSNMIVPRPLAQSVCPDPPQDIVAAIQAGTITEHVAHSNLFAVDASLSDIHATLLQIYESAQASLDATNPPLGGLVGSTWDGTNWE